jgi:uncharacterized protein
MTVVYVCSSESFAGKSTACLVLSRHFREMGLKVGYFKPIGTLPTRIEGVTSDEDALFIARELGIEASPDALCPVLLTPETLRQVLIAATPDFAGKVRNALTTASRGMDVVLAGGVGSACYTGIALGLTSAKVAGLLGAKTLLMGRYTNERSIEMILAAKAMLGDAMVGTILNRVPEEQLQDVKDTVVPFLEGGGIPVFGVLPADVTLHAVSIREAAEILGAEIISSSRATDALIEQFSVGAMNVESALRYFRRTANKAVITGGDRVDIQLAALETSTRCLILTGGMYPDARILGRAEEVGVPVLLTSDDTLTAVEKIERRSGKLRVREPQKISRAVELTAKHVDLKRLDAALGISV